MPEEILETPQPIQPTESKPTNWTKIILATILGIGLLVGSAYAGYYYGTQQVQPVKKTTPVVSQPTPSPTPAVEDETKDWETYTNTKHGYSFKYPPIAQVKSHTREESYQEVTQTSDTVAIVKSIPEFSHVIGISCLSNCLSSSPYYEDEESPIEFKDLNQYVEETLNVQGDQLGSKDDPYEIFGSFPLKIITYENITVDGKDAIRLVADLIPTSGVAPGFYLDTIYIEKNPGEVWSVGSAEWGDLDKSVSMLETIISTFKFL